MTSAIDSLKDLHTGLVDTRNGYEEAVKDGKESDLLPLFERMIVLHGGAAGEVAAMLSGMGVTAGEAGSFMSTVNRTVISLRSMVTGLGENILPALASGEEIILKKYDTALAAGDLKPADQALLQARRDELENAIGRMHKQASP